MTKNSARKKAARLYQSAHPATRFPDALRAVTRPRAAPRQVSDVVVQLELLELVRRMSVRAKENGTEFIHF